MWAVYTVGILFYSSNFHSFSAENYFSFDKVSGITTALTCHY